MAHLDSVSHWISRNEWQSSWDPFLIIYVINTKKIYQQQFFFFDSIAEKFPSRNRVRNRTKRITKDQLKIFKFQIFIFFFKFQSKIFSYVEFFWPISLIKRLKLIFDPNLCIFEANLILLYQFFRLKWFQNR